MNSRNRILTYAIAIILIAGSVTQSRADLSLGFSTDNGQSLITDMETSVGSSVFVDVFLRDSETDGVLTSEGLLGFGLAASADSTNAVTIADAAIAEVFDFDIMETFTAKNIEWADAVLSNAIPIGQQTLLGTIRLDAISEGVTTFSFRDIQPGSGSVDANWLSGNGEILDEEIFGPGSSNTFELTISVSSIPEPASGCTLVPVTCLLILRRKRVTG